MRRFFGKIQQDKVVVEGEEFEHITRVIRLKEGDKFIAIVGDQFDYTCTIEKIEKHLLYAKIIDKQNNFALPKKNIVLFQALPKKEAFERILQKSVELGANKVIPFVSTHVDNKGNLNIQRLKTIVLSACKQCERSQMMEVEQLQNFDFVLKLLQEFDVVLFANEYDCDKDLNFDFTALRSNKNIAIIVGCEGGFTESEKNRLLELKNVKSISLGSRILRADTASILLLGIASLLSGN